jgi:hypothetical protein
MLTFYHLNILTLEQENTRLPAPEGAADGGQAENTENKKYESKKPSKYLEGF